MTEDRPLREHIADYLDALSYEKGYAPNTCRAYRHDLYEFLDYLNRTLERSDDRPVQTVEVSPLMIRGFLGVLHRKNSRNTVGRKLAAVRAFFQHMVQQGTLDGSPADLVQTPKKEKTIPSYLSVDDMFRLLDAIEDDSLLGLRNRALFETLYSTGVRVSELVGLNRFDVDESEGMVRVRGKGDRERIIPVGEKALDAVRSYRDGLAEAGKVSPDADGPLFLNRDGGRLTARSVRRILDRLLKTCGLFVSVSPHGIRHTFASHLLDAGADLRALQELLGHKNLSTTQRYTHISIDQLMATYDKAHPRR